MAKEREGTQKNKEGGTRERRSSDNDSIVGILVTRRQEGGTCFCRLKTKIRKYEEG